MRGGRPHCAAQGASNLLHSCHRPCSSGTPSRRLQRLLQQLTQCNLCNLRAVARSQIDRRDSVPETTSSMAAVQQVRRPLRRAVCPAPTHLRNRRARLCSRIDPKSRPAAELHTPMAGAVRGAGEVASVDDEGRPLAHGYLHCSVPPPRFGGHLHDPIMQNRDDSMGHCAVADRSIRHHGRCAPSLGAPQLQS